MSKIKKRDTVRVSSDDFEIFQKFAKKTKYFDNNIHVFTTAVLIGKYVLQESEKLKKPKDYFRPESNESSEYLIILKCLAISDMDDVNILTDEDKLYSYCEKYTGPGIRELNKWYNSNEISFEDALINVLMKAWENIDIELLNKLRDRI